MPESRRKRYLSGSDWVIATLDHLLKQTTCAGNINLVALLLDGPLSESAFAERLAGFVGPLPVLEGRIARDARLAPYWKIPASLKRRVGIHATSLNDVTSMGELLPALARSSAIPFRDEREHLDFRIFSDSGRSVLVMRFDHRLFDARGAESFLNCLQQPPADRFPSAPITFTSSAELTDWGAKFRAGTNVNRRIIALSRSTPMALPPRSGGTGNFTYRLLGFDRGETELIFRKACSMAGYLMESPFLLAVVTRSVHELFVGRSATGESYLVPVTVDLKPGRESLPDLFFNQVSYLYYQIPLQAGDDLPELVLLYKRQMYDQVKSGFARDLAQATLLSRIAPLPLMGRMMRIPLKGRMASFVFSHLGRSAYQSSKFMGLGVDNVLHLPRVPYPPGLGFFSSVYGDRLTMTIACLDGLLDERELDLLERNIRQHIGAEAS